MIDAIIRCQKDAFMGASADPCPRVTLHPQNTFVREPITVEEVPAAIAARLVAEGWVTIDGQHYCPRHTPDMIGNIIAIVEGYTPIGDGWEARVPNGERAMVRIEVRRVAEKSGT